MNKDISSQFISYVCLVILCFWLIYLSFFWQKGLSEEEVRAAAACAGDEVMIRNQFMEMNAPKDTSVSK